MYSGENFKKNMLTFSQQFIEQLDRMSARIKKNIKNNTINQQNLIDIYRTLHPKIAEHTTFSIARGAQTNV